MLTILKLSWISGAFDSKGTRIMIKNFNMANDHLGGLLNSFWTVDFVLVKTLAFSKCFMS